MRAASASSPKDFPSFSEGLSLRLGEQVGSGVLGCRFPFLFGGAFIEANRRVQVVENH